MEQLNRWYKELIRLSETDYKQTDSELFNFYKDALKLMKIEIKQYIDKYETLSFSKQLEAERLIKVADRVDEILTDLNKKSGSIIRQHIDHEFKAGYFGTWYALEGAENVTLDFTMISERYIEELMEKPVAYKTLSNRLYESRADLAKAVTNELKMAALRGDGYDNVAKNVSELAEANYKQSLRIARTEGGRAQSTGKQKAYKEAEKKGVNLEKRWLSTLDKKTRHSHQELDGQTVGIDEQFVFDSYKADGPRLFKHAALDINCRCTTIAVVNGIAPDVRKDNLTGEQIDYANYGDWYKSKRVQDVLGKQKYADYVGKLSKKYGTNNFSKLLDKMSDKDYEKLNIIDVTGKPEVIDRDSFKKAAPKAAPKQTTTKATTKPKAITKKPTYYTTKQVDAMGENKLLEVARDLSLKYHASGKTGISYGGRTPEQVTNAMLVNQSKTALRKDIKAMQRALKKWESE